MERSTIVKIHVVYWVLSIVLYFFAFTFPFYQPSEDFNYLFWGSTLCNQLYITAEFYLYYSVLVPKYILKEQRYVTFIFLSLVIMVVSVTVFILIWNSYVLFYGEFNYQQLLFKDLMPLMDSATYTPVFAVSVKLIETWSSSELLKQKIEQLNVNSRIAFLKSQINPHFIFNTLNNIYSLSLKGSQLTATSLDKLQSSFSYLKKIEHAKTVSVKDEIDYLKSFIELSKLRLTKPDKIQVSLFVMNNEKNIYPMLLIPFIENAFKHARLSSESDFLSIDIHQKESFIMMKVENTFSEKTTSKDKHKGIGLNNVRERLALLYNKNEYELEMEIIGNKHITNLRIPYAIL